jgi:hypothetical protein
MKPRDEMTALAADYLNNREAIAKHVGEAFANIPRAPLAKLICDFLALSPQIDIAPILKKIAETNQGRLEDLNVTEFQSYLIAKCMTSEIELHRAISTLSNFANTKPTYTNGDKPLLIAARDENNSGQKSTTMNDLVKQIGKRRK